MSNSSTKVRLNAKLSNSEIFTAKYDGVSTLIEGQPFVIGAGRIGAALSGTDSTSIARVYINFVDSTRSDVSSVMRDALTTGSELASWKHASGALAGILGQNTMIGLPLECWESTPGIDEGVFVGTNGKFETEPIGVLKKYYGIVDRYEDGAYWFIFSSVPQIFNALG